MISRLPLSYLRQSLFKQSVRSVNATVAASARDVTTGVRRGRLFFGQSANTTSSERSPQWDSTPQHIWISDSIPDTSQLKAVKSTMPMLEKKFHNRKNVLLFSKGQYTGWRLHHLQIRITISVHLESMHRSVSYLSKFSR